AGWRSVVRKPPQAVKLPRTLSKDDHPLKACHPAADPEAAGETDIRDVACGRPRVDQYNFTDNAEPEQPGVRRPWAIVVFEPYAPPALLREMLAQPLQPYVRRQIIGDVQARGSAPADLDIRRARHNQIAAIARPGHQQP